MIRVQLDATKRKAQAVDWREKVPKLPGDALVHVEERVKAERAIAKYRAEARDEAEEPMRKSRAAELVDIVEDCVRRHSKLHTHLMGPAIFSGSSRIAFPGAAGSPAIIRHSPAPDPRPVRPPPHACPQRAAHCRV
ncbi:hypothetical protein [Streptomyces mirabilis]|uniref:hypothetical protein n=1 Tax=Streptomyces mirabilis TaxID=68239 RepID=UPI00331990A8